MIKCKVCGESLNENDRFCSSCGSPTQNRTDKGTDKNREAKKIKNVEGKSSASQSKSISGVKIFYFIFGLAIIGAVILFSSGIFEKPAITGSNAQQADDPHVGVDLTKLQELNALEEALKKNPNYAKLLELAHMLNDSGFKEKAIEKYKEYLKKNPKSPDVIVDMGVCYYDLGRYEEALKFMKEAIALKPDHQIAHLNMGVISLAINKHDEAIEWWKKAVAINPATDVAKRAQELINSH